MSHSTKSRIMNGVFNEGERMGLQLPNPPSPWAERDSSCEARLPLASWKSSTNVAPQFLQPVCQGCMHITSIEPWIHGISQCFFFSWDPEHAEAPDASWVGCTNIRHPLCCIMANCSTPWHPKSDKRAFFTQAPSYLSIAFMMSSR